MSLIKSLGRVCLAGIFIMGGGKTFLEPDGRAVKVANAGIPQPRQATILNGATMVVAGTAMAVGIAPKLAATALIGSLIPTTLVGHAFWAEENAASVANQQTQFFKNLAMLGGLLVYIAS